MKQNGKKTTIRVKTKHGKKMTTLGNITGLFQRPVDYRTSGFDYFLRCLAKDFLDGESTLFLNTLNEEQKKRAIEYLRKIKKQK